MTIINPATFITLTDEPSPFAPDSAKRMEVSIRLFNPSADGSVPANTYAYSPALHGFTTPSTVRNIGSRTVVGLSHVGQHLVVHHNTQADILNIAERMRSGSTDGTHITDQEIAQEMQAYTTPDIAQILLTPPTPAPDGD